VLDTLEPRRFLAAVMINETVYPSTPEPFTARGNIFHWDTYTSSGGDSGYPIITSNYTSTTQSDGTRANTFLTTYESAGLFGPDSAEISPGSSQFFFLRGEALYTGNRKTGQTTLIKHFGHLLKRDVTQWGREDLPGAIVVLNGIGYFAADDAGATLIDDNYGVPIDEGPPSDAGMEFWRTDGTLKGTYVLKDIQPLVHDPVYDYITYTDSNPGGLTVLNGRVYFTANVRDEGGTQIWSTDGTAGGTVQLTNFTIKSSKNKPLILGTAGDQLIFSSESGSTRRLFALSGVDQKVRFLKQVAVTRAISAGRRLFFAGTDVEHGTEMWSTDGTADGTVLLKDVNPGTGSGVRSDDWAIVDGSLYFHEWDGLGRTVLPHEKLYVSDGTPGGTVPVRGDVFDAENLIARAGKLFYFIGVSVYSYTPAAPAAHLLATVPVPVTSFPNEIFVTDSKILFTTQPDDSGPLRSEIWAIDTNAGAISGTVFDDVNANAARDPGEAVLPGYKVFIDRNGDGVCNYNEISTRANSKGRYRFDGLPAGTYTVRIVGVLGRRASPSDQYRIRLPADTSVTRNFGRTNLPMLFGFVYDDHNANGTIDLGDLGLRAWTVYIDANQNGALDEGETSAVTNANGKFTFATLAAGTHRLRVVPQANYRQTSPLSGYRTVTLAPTGVSGIPTFGQTSS
jgi:ELWxxDGT repeat protein